MRKLKKAVVRFFKGNNHKYINGSRGVISIFLACLMVPFAYLADLLIESGRYSQSISQLDQIVDSAETSVLANYDEYMLNRFGFLSVSQAESCEEQINSFIEKISKGLSDNLDISADSVSGLLSLKNKETLLRQIGEAGKYSIPAYFAGTTLNELLSKLENLGNFSAIMEMISSSGKAVNSLVEFKDAMNKLKDSSEALENNRIDYINKKNSFQSAVNILIGECSRLDSAKSDLNSAISNRDSKQSENTNAQNAYTAAQNKLDDYLSWIGNSSLDSAHKSNLSSKINSFKNSPSDSTLKAINDYIEDKKISDKKVSDTNGNEYKLSQIYQMISNLDLKSKKDSASSTSSDLSSANSEVSSAQSKVNQIESELAPKRNNVDSKKAEYIEAINKLTGSNKGSLKDYSEKFKTAVDARDNVSKQIASTTETIYSNSKKISDESRNSAKKEKKDLEKQKETLSKDKEKNQKEIDEIDERIEDCNNTIKDVDAVDNNTDTAFEDTKKITENAINDDFFNKKYGELVVKAISDLNNIKSNLNGISGNSISSSTKLDTSAHTIDGKSYYRDISDAYSKKDTIESVIQKLRESTNDTDDIIEQIKAIVSSFRSMIKASGVYNPNLKACLEAGLTDEVSALEALMNSIADLLTATTELGKGFIWDFLPKLVEVIKKACDVVVKFVSFVADYIGSTITSIAELCTGGLGTKLLLTQYCVMSLPDRTNYSTGESKITGMKYSAMARTDCGEHELDDMFSTLSDIINLYNSYKNKGGSDKVFCGAELEFMRFGSSSEIANQIGVFIQLFALRSVLSLFGVMSNTFVQALAAGLGAITFGIGEPLVYIIYMFTEGLIDTAILCGGGKVPFIKLSKDVYLSPEGIPSLISALTSLNVSSEIKDEIKSDGEKLGIEVQKDVPDNKKIDVSAKSTSGGIGSKILDFFKLDYTSYMFLFLLLNTPEDMLVSRLQNLMNLECKEYYRVEGESFEISHTYTYIQVDATATFSPILPLEPMSVAAFNKVSTSQYRGY